MPVGAIHRHLGLPACQATDEPMSTIRATRRTQWSFPVRSATPAPTRRISRTDRLGLQSTNFGLGFFGKRRIGILRGQCLPDFDRLGDHSESLEAAGLGAEPF